MIYTLAQKANAKFFDQPDTLLANERYVENVILIFIVEQRYLQEQMAVLIKFLSNSFTLLNTSRSIKPEYNVSLKFVLNVLNS